MRLCTICDKKIEGTWCKTCHKFVKTYELPNRIYLNERHDPVNDKDCTYHTDMSETVFREKTSSGTHRTYSSTSSASTSGTGRPVTKKKGKKTALFVIIGYIIVNCLGFIGPFVGEVIEGISEGFQEGFYGDEYYEEEIALTPEEEQALQDGKNRDALLQDLTPASYFEEDTYEFWYYTPEEIKEIGYPCDEPHFAMKLEEFETQLVEERNVSFEYADDVSMYDNYYYKTDDYRMVRFACYRDYSFEDALDVRVEYDTATMQLHTVRIDAKAGDMASDFYFALLRAFDPETLWSKYVLELFLNEAIEDGENATIYYSENLSLWFETSEEGYTLVFYPGY